MVEEVDIIAGKARKSEKFGKKEAVTMICCSNRPVSPRNPFSLA